MEHNRDRRESTHLQPAAQTPPVSPANHRDRSVSSRNVDVMSRQSKRKALPDSDSESDEVVELTSRRKRRLPLPDDKTDQDMDSAARGSSSTTPIFAQVKQLRNEWQKLQREYGDISDPTKVLILALSSDIQFSEGKGRVAEAITRSRKKDFAKHIWRKCIRSKASQAYKDYLTEHGISQSRLDELIRRNCGKNGFTQNTGISIPNQDYAELMSDFLTLCESRFVDMMSNILKKISQPVVGKLSRSKLLEAEYLQEYKWLYNCEVFEDGTPIRPNENQDGVSKDEIIQSFSRIDCLEPQEIEDIVAALLKKLLVRPEEIPRHLKMKAEKTAREEIISELRASQEEQEGMPDESLTPAFGQKLFDNWCSQQPKEFDKRQADWESIEFAKHVSDWDSNCDVVVDRVRNAFQKTVPHLFTTIVAPNSTPTPSR